MREGDKVRLMDLDTGEEVIGVLEIITPGAPGHLHYTVCGGEPEIMTGDVVMGEAVRFADEVINRGRK